MYHMAAVYERTMLYLYIGAHSINYGRRLKNGPTKSKFSNFRICLDIKNFTSKRPGDRIFHILTIPVSGTVVPLI